MHESDIHHDDLGSSPSSKSPPFPPSSYPEEGGTGVFSEDASASVAEARELIKVLYHRTYHHRSELERWGVAVHGTDDRWFAFISDREVKTLAATTAADAASRKGHDE